MKEPIHLLDICYLCFHHIKKIILIPLLFACIGFTIAYWFITPVYEAKTDILVNNPFTDDDIVSAADIETNLRLIETYSSIIESDRVANLVAKKGNYDYSSKELREKLRVKSNDNSQIIQLYIKNRNPKDAVKLANLYVTIFQKEIKTLMHLDITILSKAEEVKNNKPITPKPPFITVVSFFIGFFSVCFYIALSSYFIPKVMSEKDITRHVELPVYGTVRQIKRVYPKKQTNIQTVLQTYFKKEKRKFFPPAALQAYRNIRTRLNISLQRENSQSLLITSSRDNEGKTITASNLAMFFALNKQKTILIDGNTNIAATTSPTTEGLADYLSGNATIDQIIQSTPIHYLHYIDIGSFTPLSTELFATERIDVLFTELKKTFDRIIIDSSTVHFPDTLILATKVDGCLLTVQARKTKIANIKKSVQQLKDIGVTLYGVIINRQRYKQVH